MALREIWGVSRAIMRLLVIQFVCWVGWFSTFALAQFEISEGVTGSVTFPALGVTCVANLAVFVTSLIRGRLDLEMGARDVLDILCNPELHVLRIKHGSGLTTRKQEDAAIRRGGDPETASIEENDVQTGGGDPQTASKEENDVQTTSTRGPETASTEGNFNRTASTGGGGLHTASTEEIVLQIGSEEAEIAGFSTGKLDCNAGVIMLSNSTGNWSMRQFIKSNARVVQSIVLEFLPLERAINVAKVKKELTSRVTILESCKCTRCDCIVFWTMEETTHMLASRMPGTLKPLSNSLCLLPCSTCLTNGCHALPAEGEASQPLRECVVSGILHDIHAGSIHEGKPICLCIPMNDVRSDNWTKLLVRSLRSKDAESRGVRNMATEALQGYLVGGRGSEEGTVKYDIFSFVVPRLTEVLVNLVLTFWFRVDGFSSALVARRTVRDYLVDSKSSGFAANAFLAKAVVKSNGDNSQVCQVLTFRGRDTLCMITFISVGCVNFICSLGWALLISFEGGTDNSQPPSLPIVAVIIAAIGTPWLVSTLVMGRYLGWFFYCCGGCFCEGVSTVVVILFSVVMTLFVVVISPVSGPGIIISGILTDRDYDRFRWIAIALILEMACFVSWSALAGTVGIKGFGRWIYAALQILIWLKWATGSYLLSEENSVEFFGKNPEKEILLIYSFSFWLNAVLAGVRSKWEAWPWRHNHLFSFMRG